MRDFRFARAVLGTVLVFTLTAGLGGCRSPEVTAGSWNIEWLGRPERRAPPRRDVAQRPEDLAWYIEESGVDVLALQEIKADVREPDGWRNSTLDETFALLDARTGSSWTHVLFPDRRDGTQITGIAWNRDVVQAVGAPMPIPVSHDPGPIDRRLWDRPPYAMAFTTGPGRTDFVVIPLHQKSNYGGDYAAHRAVETRELVDQLDAIAAHFDDTDLLVIGDTNCPAHDDEGVQILVRAGYRDGNARDVPTHPRGGGLDRAYTPVDEPEFVGRFRVLGPDVLADAGWTVEAFRLRGSDHYMVTTQIRVLPDDDGPIDK